MAHVFISVKKHFSLIPLLMYALTIPFSQVAFGADVTFTNETQGILYMRVFNGACNNKPTPNTAFSLNPQAAQSVTPVGGASACYVASRLADPNQAPTYCGTATAPTAIKFDLSSPFCMSIERSKLAGQQAKPTSGKSAAKRNVSEGTIFLSDDIHLDATLAQWTDPLTPPQTSARCSREAWGDWPWGGQWRFCVEWSVDCQWMQNKLKLYVSSAIETTTYDKLKDTVKACLNDAVVGGAVAGVVAAVGTGGTGVAVATQVFQDLFLTCVTATIPKEDIHGISLGTTSQWSQWGVCVKPQ